MMATLAFNELNNFEKLIQGSRKFFLSCRILSLPQIFFFIVSLLMFFSEGIKSIATQNTQKQFPLMNAGPKLNAWKSAYHVPDVTWTSFIFPVKARLHQVSLSLHFKRSPATSKDQKIKKINS